MAFLEEAKKVGMTEKDAKVFQAFVKKAKENKFSNEEILDAWENRKPPIKDPEINAPDQPWRRPKEETIQAPISTADKTSELMRRGRPTEFTKNLVEYAPETLGATALLTVGAPVTIPGSMGLAALGGAGGRGYQLATRSLTGAPGAPSTATEAVLDVGAAGARQGIAEGMGRAVLRTIGRFVKGGFLKPSVEAAGPDMERRAAVKAARLSGDKVALLKARGTPTRDVMEAFGGKYTAAQQTDSRVMDFLDNMAQGSFLGGGIMDKSYHAQQKSLQEIGDTVADAIIREGQDKLSDRELGQLFVDTVQNGRSAFKASAEKMFRNVDDLVYEEMQKGAQQIFPKQAAGIAEKSTRIPRPVEYGYVNTKPLAERAVNIISEYKRISNIGKSDAGGQLLDKVAAIPERMTFGDAQLLRSGLLEEVRALSKEGGQGLRYASELAGLADKQMERAASNLGGDALNAWRDANKFYKFGKTNFDNEFIKKLTKSDKVNWSEVGDIIFRSGDDDAVRSARRALRAAEFTSRKEGTNVVEFSKVWRQMQGGYYDSLIRKNTGVDGILKPSGLLKDLNNRKTERTIKAAFNNDQLNAIRNFAKAAEMASDKNKSKAGSMVIQFAQGSTLLGLVTPSEFTGDYGDAIRKVGGGVLLGPYVLAKMLTNPMATRWLIQGLQTPISSGASGGLGARLSLAAVKALQDTLTIGEEKPQK